MKKIFSFFPILFLLAGCAPLGAPAAPQATLQGPGTTATVSSPTLSPSPLPTTSRADPITAADAARLQETGVFPIANPYRLYFSPDSLHAIVTTQEQVVRFSLSGLEQENRLALAESDSLLAVSPEKGLAAVTSDHVTINLISLASGQVVQSFQPRGAFSAAFFTPDGASLSVVKVDEIGVDIYDLSDGSLTRELGGFQTAAPVYNVFPAGDGAQLAWVSRGRLQLMDFPTGRLGPEFAHEDFIAGWDLSLDGSLIATSAGGQLDEEFFPLLFLWDAHSGQQLQAEKLPEAPAASLAFSPDGQILAAAVGKTIRFYQVPTLDPIVTLSGPAENISFLVFSPDGRNLLASAQDGAVHLWQVVP